MISDRWVLPQTWKNIEERNPTRRPLAEVTVVNVVNVDGDVGKPDQNNAYNVAGLEGPEEDRLRSPVPTRPKLQNELRQVILIEALRL
jgi:hypothetical protein